MTLTYELLKKAAARLDIFLEMQDAEVGNYSDIEKFVVTDGTSFLCEPMLHLAGAEDKLFADLPEDVIERGEDLVDELDKLTGYSYLDEPAKAIDEALGMLAPDRVARLNAEQDEVIDAFIAEGTPTKEAVLNLIKTVNELWRYDD